MFFVFLVFNCVFVEYVYLKCLYYPLIFLNLLTQQFCEISAKFDSVMTLTTSQMLCCTFKQELYSFKHILAYEISNLAA